MAVMLLVFFFQAFQWLHGVIGWSPTFGIGTITLSHIAFNISFVAVVVRARLGQLDPSPRGGRRRPLRQPLAGVPPGHVAADQRRGCCRGAAGAHPVPRRRRDHHVRFRARLHHPSGLCVRPGEEGGDTPDQCGVGDHAGGIDGPGGDLVRAPAGVAEVESASRLKQWLINLLGERSPGPQRRVYSMNDREDECGSASSWPRRCSPDHDGLRRRRRRRRCHVHRLRSRPDRRRPQLLQLDRVHGSGTDHRIRGRVRRRRRRVLLRLQRGDALPAPGRASTTT